MDGIVFLISLSAFSFLVYSNARDLNNGSLVLVHRPERLTDIIVLMQKYNISPKKIQFIYPKEKTESNMILIEGTKNGNNAIKVIEPLIIHDDNGEYRDEIKKIFTE